MRDGIWRGPYPGRGTSARTARVGSASASVFDREFAEFPAADVVHQAREIFAGGARRGGRPLPGRPSFTCRQFDFVISIVCDVMSGCYDRLRQRRDSSGKSTGGRLEEKVESSGAGSRCSTPGIISSPMRFGRSCGFKGIWGREDLPSGALRLQVAAGFHHFCRGNRRGTSSLFAAGPGEARWVSGCALGH